MEFSNRKWQVLERTNHIHEHRLGPDQMDSSFAEKDLDNKLNISYKVMIFIIENNY